MKLTYISSFAIFHLTMRLRLCHLDSILMYSSHIREQPDSSGDGIANQSNNRTMQE
jgi:hypothetical protein